MSENNNSKMCCGHKPRLVLPIIGLVLLTGIIVISIVRDRIVSQQFRQVTINGQGRVSYTPDLAMLNLGVQIDKVAKPEEALNQLNSKVEGIVKALGAAGIADENIQTQNYSLYPQYDYKDNVSTVSGYNANEQLVIKIVDYDQNPEKLSQVIAASSKAGINQVNGLWFEASDINDLKQEARIKAIEDARSKSQVLAETAGVRLKKVVGWWENFIQPSPYYSYDGKGGASGANPQLPAGDREVIVELGVTYNIK